MLEADKLEVAEAEVEVELEPEVVCTTKEVIKGKKHGQKRKITT
jgi:hypothetical protein